MSKFFVGEMVEYQEMGSITHGHIQQIVNTPVGTFYNIAPAKPNMWSLSAGYTQLPEFLLSPANSSIEG
jgi:hypothetical protein